MRPQKIALLTDSCADLSPKVAKENHIFVVPLRILCTDGSEVVLRGCAGLRNIFEAVPADSITADWYRLAPLEES